MVTAEAVIDIKALMHNYNTLKSLCKGQRVIAVVKGDAYGHGAVRVAQVLHSSDMFAVSRIEEAIELRQERVKNPILLLEGCFCADDLVLASKYNLDTTIHCKEQLDELESTPFSRAIHVWIKLDTGMHRLGFQPHELSSVTARIEASKKAILPVGFMSHFSSAYDKCSKRTEHQINCFLEATAPYLGPKTLANSAGVLYWDQSCFDYCRLGIALYGISPAKGETGAKLGLKPVMTLRTRLIAVRRHRAYQPIGYGGEWIPCQDTNIGVVAMGYGDGFPRGAPSGTPVYINGRRVPIVGCVSMDMITVDLGLKEQDKIGDIAEFWGSGLPVEVVSETAGTIPYELVVKLAKRVKRTYLGY